MASYRLGSKGTEVSRIQQRLKEEGLYLGPVDGDFGGGTEAAVRVFQAKEGLEVDGNVGPITWKALFAQEILAPSILDKPLNHRSLALTGTFETGQAPPECFTGLSGDFDGQGISFGVLQWNFGQGSLQPLLREMIDQHDDIVRSIFQDHYGVLIAALQSDRDALLAFARSIQHSAKHFVFEPWKGMFKSLGRTEEFQEIQVRHAANLFNSAINLCAEYGLTSQRAAALMFDIKVQNGSISNQVKHVILQDFHALPANLSGGDLEVAKMRIVANRRAEAANPRWIEDVRARKLCLANGGGAVHGIVYDLDEQFGIGLASLQAGKATNVAAYTPA
ncbi:MAG: peptidoglycan-binding protein [Nitrospirota bacterium]|nr:peptidoglycan-binding protein [Nitrospirota bacterium]